MGFRGVQQATSVRHLDLLLRNDYGGIITTTLQKFQEADKDATDGPDPTGGAGNPTDPDDPLDEPAVPPPTRPILTSQVMEGNNLVTIEKELID